MNYYRLWSKIDCQYWLPCAICPSYQLYFQSAGAGGVEAMSMCESHLHHTRAFTVDSSSYHLWNY